MAENILVSLMTNEYLIESVLKLLNAFPFYLKGRESELPSAGPFPIVCNRARPKSGDRNSIWVSTGAAGTQAFESLATMSQGVC